MSKPTLTLEMVARAVCAIDDYLPNRIDQIEQVRAALAEEGEQEQPAPQGDKQLEKQPPTWLCDECRQQWIMADIAPERPRLAQEGPWRVERNGVKLGCTLTDGGEFEADLMLWKGEKLAALLNAGARAQRRVAELESEMFRRNQAQIEQLRVGAEDIIAERDTLAAKVAELENNYNTLLDASVTTIEERNAAQAKLRELAELAEAAYGNIPAKDKLRRWLSAHPELLEDGK